MLVATIPSGQAGAAWGGEIPGCSTFRLNREIVVTKMASDEGSHK